MHRTRAVVGALGLTAALALIGVGVGPASAAGGGGRSHRDDPTLAQLAAEQTQAWETEIGGRGGVPIPPLSPTTCVRSQLDDDIVMLPVLTGVATPASASCTVSRDDHLLLDVGGAVLWQDANVCGGDPELCFLIGTEAVPFRPENLQRIADQLLVDLAPFGSATLDGRAVRPTVLATTFPLTVPSTAFNFGDSEAVGTPGHLAGAFAGQKVVLDELRKGVHTIKVHNNLGFDITYTITVR